MQRRLRWRLSRYTRIATFCDMLKFDERNANVLGNLIDSSVHIRSAIHAVVTRWCVVVFWEDHEHRPQVSAGGMI